MFTWWKDLKIGTKLVLSFVAVVALTLLVAGVGFRTVLTLSRLGDKGLAHGFGLGELMEAEANSLRISRAVRNAILDDTEEQVRKRMDDVRTYDTAFRAAFSSYEKSIELPATREKAREAAKLFDETRVVQDEMLQLALHQRDREANELRSSARELADKFDAGVDELVKIKIETMQGFAKEQDQTAASAKLFTIVLSLVAAIVALALGVFISRTIADALVKTMRTAQQAAEGDLTVRVPVSGKDEFGLTADALNQFLTTLHDSMRQVAQSSQAVAGSSRELSSSAQSISSGAQEQASSLEETAASLEEMTSTVKQNADNAQQAAQLAQGARDVAEKGGHVVGTAVDAMKEINNASRKIADIITTIDEIAFQTNLLALNAAVEAARAGEQGRGFAVVAGEVRNLAQRSATAAKEIKGLIQDTVEKVESGSRLVNQSGQTLDEIVVSVKKVTDLIAEIAAASKEQSSGIDQVNTAVTQMDSVTQSNASQTEELAGTSEALASQAQQLMALVERFQLGDGGADHAAVATVRVANATPNRSASKRGQGLKLVVGPGGRKPASESTAKTGTHDGFEEF